jgi:hypothetical protein
MERISNSQNLKLKIKTINSTVYEVLPEITDTVLTLKRKILEKSNIPIANQRLIYQGKVLSNEKLLNEFKLANDHVIHLIEQEVQNPRTSFLEPLSSQDNSNRNQEFFNMLLGSNPLTSNLRLSQNDNFITNIINDQNNNSQINISESFKNFEKKSNFNKNECIEVLVQNFNNFKEILKNQNQISNNDYEKTQSLYEIHNKNQNIKYKVGQWVDVKDSVDQWIEAQIIDIKENKAHIKFLGWGRNWNEWIKLDSDRISLFRTQTIQSPFSKHYSPFPNSRSEGEFAFTDVKKFDQFDCLSDILEFMDLTRDKLMMINHEKENFQSKKYNNLLKDSEIKQREKFLLLNFMQISPLIDRLGRLLLDFSRYLMNYSFLKFEDSINEFKQNIENFNRINNQDFTSLSSLKLGMFQNLVKLPVMRQFGEVAEAQNLSQPRLGIIVGIHQSDRGSIVVQPTPHQTTQNISQQQPAKFERNKLNIRVCENFTLDKNERKILKNYSANKETQTQLTNNRIDNFCFSLFQTNKKIILNKEINPIISKNTDKIVIEAKDKSMKSKYGFQNVHPSNWNSTKRANSIKIIQNNNNSNKPKANTYLKISKHPVK